MLATPGTHERHLQKLFAGRMSFADQDPAFDRPLMIIAFSNRSGSNLVCDYALQSGRVAGAGEYLNHDVVEVQARGAGVASLPDYIRHLDRTLAQSSKVLALKASWDQLAMLVRHNITGMFHKTLVLHCTRNDTLAQAVSYAIALRSGRWMSTTQTGAAPDPSDIPLSEIEMQMEEFHRANLLIRMLCEAHGLRRWDIGYERLCQDKGAHLAQALRAAALVPPGWLPGVPRLERQAGPLNETLAGDFLASVRTTTGGAGPDRTRG
jgi:LPS sulfotransferase NodH